MKKLFTTVVLLLFFVLPLGSSQSKLYDGKFRIKRAYESVIDNRKKQLTCLAKNIYFEARNEPFAGQFAVALVTLNRVKDTTFPDTICKVVYQGKTYKSWITRKNRCQFSWYCDGKSDRIPSTQMHNFENAQNIANAMLLEYELSQRLDYTEGAIYYHTYEISPRWSNSFPKVGRIGDHIFYR